NVDNLINFIKGRFKLIFEENEVQYDIINCVLNLSDIIPYYSYKNAKYIKEIYDESNFIEFVKAYKRIFNIAKDYKEVSEIRKALFIKDEEKNLYEEYLSIKDYIEKNKILDFSIFFNKSTDLVNKINKFFDNVLVMDKDENIKNNRLNLIKNILILMKTFGSFDEIIKS
ncbi:MAG TPA: DALR anticodon-binding domain-containing protein, partial [Caldisericia bacterium]|nr:DALR anticodon-binding domain-containing protein [Caldisericia bacterium]